MELTIAGVIAAVGLLFGVNFLGLFVAAYIFDRRAKSILWYVAGVGAFMANGVSYLLSILTPYTAAALAFVEIFHSLGLVCLAFGIGHAFRLRISRKLVWGVYAFACCLALALSPLAETNVLRLTFLCTAQIFFSAYLGSKLLLAEDRKFKHKFLAFLIGGIAVAALSRPVVAAIVNSYVHLTFEQQVGAYAAVVIVTHLIALFGLGTGVFFQVMSDLASGYRKASITDDLTGVLNRRGFLEACERVNATPSMLIMLDIDQFKSVNDSYGHDAGDRALIAVADILRGFTAAPNFCGRLGGEEFAILLVRADRGTGNVVAHSLRQTMEINLRGVVAPDHSLTASFGVAHFEPSRIYDALSAADSALYDAKRAGRNSVRLSDENMPADEVEDARKPVRARLKTAFAKSKARS